jgi:pilus assembly protein CpaB
MTLPDRLPPHAITDSPEARASLRGALVPRYLDAGAPVTLDDVLRPRDRGFLATVLAPGARAVSVAVDAVSGVAGLIWPGDRVDVLLTQQIDTPDAPPSRRLLSRTILTEIRVIAVDQQIVEGATGDVQAAGKVARTVTMEVSPEQAERLAVAQRLGFLSLAIRPLKESSELTAAMRDAVFGGDLSPELPRANARPGVGMEIIEGGQRSVVKFP